MKYYTFFVLSRNKIASSTKSCILCQHIPFFQFKLKIGKEKKILVTNLMNFPLPAHGPVNDFDLLC